MEASVSTIVRPDWLQCKPVTRWRQSDDPFFDEGNRACRLANKHMTCDLPEPEDKDDLSANRKESFPCQMATCKLVFTTIREYEMHYSNVHKNVCSECHRSFPTPHLLEIHVLEWHDNMFQLLAAKKHMYQCLVESCPEKFSDAQTRKNHLVKSHRYPANFRFDKPPQKPGTKSGKLKENAKSPKQEDMDISTITERSSREGQVKVTGEDRVAAGGAEMEVESNGTQRSRSPEVGSTSQSASGRTFVYNAPKNFSFGQGVSRGFNRRRGGAGGGAGRGKKQRHWHQQPQQQQDTTTDIEQVQFMDLSQALEDI